MVQELGNLTTKAKTHALLTSFFSTFSLFILFYTLGFWNALKYQHIPCKTRQMTLKQMKIKLLRQYILRVIVLLVGLVQKGFCKCRTKTMCDVMRKVLW